MTAAELDEVLNFIEDNYPRDTIAGSTNALQSWNDALGEFSKDVCILAAREWVKENHYAPKPSDIRKLAAKSGSPKKREDIAVTHFFYLKRVDGRSYEFVALLANDKAEAARIRAAGYGGFPIVLRGSQAHKEMQTESLRIRKEEKDRENVQNQDLHNFRRDDPKP